VASVPLLPLAVGVPLLVFVSAYPRGGSGPPSLILDLAGSLADSPNSRVLQLPLDGDCVEVCTGALKRAQAVDTRLPFQLVCNDRWSREEASTNLAESPHQSTVLELSHHSWLEFPRF